MSITLTHIALHVSNLDDCVAFYQNYAGMKIVRDRKTHDNHVYWLAEPGKESEFIMVIMPGGAGRNQPTSDLSHLGFAVAHKADVDTIAKATGSSKLAADAVKVSIEAAHKLRGKF